MPTATASQGQHPLFDQTTFRASDCSHRVSFAYRGLLGFDSHYSFPPLEYQPFCTINHYSQDAVGQRHPVKDTGSQLNVFHYKA